MEPLAAMAKQLAAALNQAAESFASVKKELAETKAALAQTKKKALEDSIASLKLQIEQREENIRQASEIITLLNEIHSEAWKRLVRHGIIIDSAYFHAVHSANGYSTIELEKRNVRWTTENEEAAIKLNELLLQLDGINLAIEAEPETSSLQVSLTAPAFDLRLDTFVPFDNHELPIWTLSAFAFSLVDVNLASPHFHSRLDCLMDALNLNIQQLVEAHLQANRTFDATNTALQQVSSALIQSKRKEIEQLNDQILMRRKDIKTARTTIVFLQDGLSDTAELMCGPYGSIRAATTDHDPTFELAQSIDESLSAGSGLVIESIRRWECEIEQIATCAYRVFLILQPRDAIASMEALTATVKLLTEALAQIAGSLTTVTQKLEETAKALFSTAQSLASTKELLASTKLELATTIEELASTEEELASTKEELTSVNQSLASTKEVHEQTASALLQSKKDAIEMLKAQISSRNEDIVIAGKARAYSDYTSQW
ncbi:hypothetical protein VTO58DRAFT_104133 [Aureobasidium pullulans]